MVGRFVIPGGRRHRARRGGARKEKGKKMLTLRIRDGSLRTGCRVTAEAETEATVRSLAACKPGLRSWLQNVPSG